MDETVEMLAGHDWSKIRQTDRELACEVAAGIAGHLFRCGFALVVVAGSTVAGWEWHGLLRALEQRPLVTTVLLRVSLEESQRRATADESRLSTRDPEVVRRHYSRIEWPKIPQPDLEIETDGKTISDVVQILTDKVLRA